MADQQVTNPLARRSVSIFSRRGTVHDQDTSAMGFRFRTTNASARKNIVLSYVLRTTDASAKNGTVLNAVPQNSMSEVALLPNIIAETTKESSPLEFACATASEQADALKKVQITILADRSPRKKQSRSKPNHERIGVWINGIIHWDGARSVRPRSHSDSSGHRSRPSLTLIIPNDETAVKRPCTSGCDARHPTLVPIQPSYPVREVSPLESSSKQSSMRTTTISPAAAETVSSARQARSTSPSSITSDFNNESCESTHSSSTSLDGPTLIARELQSSRCQKSASAVFSIVNPTVENVTSGAYLYMNKPLPPTPVVLSAFPPVLPTFRLSAPPTERPRTARGAIKRISQVPTQRHTVSMNKLDHVDEEFMRTSPYCQDELPASPTLTQAEIDLDKQLEALEGLGICGLARPKTSEVFQDVAVTASPTPGIPRRSRKRDWRASSSLDSLPLRRHSDRNATQDLSVDADSHPPRRSLTSAQPRDSGLFEKQVYPITDGLIVVAGPVVMSQKTIPMHRKAAAAPQAAAEGVLVHLLASLTSIHDLMNTTLINKGMYRVYKQNEDRLLRQVAYTESPPAWELREWCPGSYVQSWKRDSKVIEKLKTMILDQCQSFMRKETVAAMSDITHSQAQQVTDAFWRIWTFCAVFGRRDQDMSGQLDWLKGGRQALNLACSATVTTFEFDVDSILLNAPEHFAQGNGDGLTADQLYDMTEIWTCMAALLHGYLGQVDEARQYGIACDEQLEEWTAWIMSLGPAVVLELATLHPSSGFALAKQNGWITAQNRAAFLKEPVAKLYEERINAAIVQSAERQTQKNATRKRVAAHALEIRTRRGEPGFQRTPYIDQTMERPMSTLSGETPLTPRRSLQIHPAFRGMQPSIHGPATTLPSVPERSALRTFNGIGVGTVELAVQRIVDMGFDEAEAREALRVTDARDGLRVDRAVEWLLRRHTPVTDWQDL